MTSEKKDAPKFLEHSSRIKNANRTFLNFRDIEKEGGSEISCRTKNENRTFLQNKESETLLNSAQNCKFAKFFANKQRDVPFAFFILQNSVQSHPFLMSRKFKMQGFQ